MPWTWTAASPCRPRSLRRRYLGATGTGGSVEVGERFWADPVSVFFFFFKGLGGGEKVLV